ncbi:MAG: histidine kinase [Pseudomonadota bacterium]
MDEFRKLPLDLDTNVPISTLLSGVGVVVNSLFVTFFLILAISAAELHAGPGKQRPWRMAGTVVLTALAASAVSVQFSIGLGALGFNPNITDFRGLFIHIVWTSLAVGALSAAYFAGWEREQEVAAQMWDARLERMDGERQLLESQLNVMKSRIEPSFLVGMISKIEALYRRDTGRAEQCLEDLIAYLRAALPQLHGTDSTLGDELALAAAYVRLHADDFREGLEWIADVNARMVDVHFPPMALLPLVDDALQRAVSLSAERLALQIRLHTEGRRFFLTVADNCPLARPGSTVPAALLLHEKSFCAFFAGTGSVTRGAAKDGGTVVTLTAEWNT